MYSLQNPNCMSECELSDKDRAQPHYFKPVQQTIDSPSPVYQPSSASSGLTDGNVPRYGTVIPNRIFVGGIDFKTKEEDLQKFFCNYGIVKDTKIIRDRANISKGYGFVTFETAEEADRVRDQEDCLYLNGKKLNIGQAVRKQQIYFPKDIHVPGPLGSWVVHPAGYASFTNSNGITYFSQSPMLSPLQQPQPYAHGHLMYGAGPTYQPLAAHYPGYAYPAAACAGQPCSTVHLPWPPTPIGGACGQLISPAVSQSTPEQLNVVTLPTQAVPTGYLVPRSVPSAAQTQVHPIPNRPPEAVVDKPLYTPTSEPVRVLVASPTYGHPQIMPSQPMYHQQSIKCAHAQYAPYAVDPSTAHYVTLHENEPTGIPHPVVTSEGELLTPPLTPEQQNQ